jgi:hypothetical protein
MLLWPSWLASTFGVDYFANVATIIMPRASGDELVHIGRLGRL